MIYLDNAATTKPCKAASDAMLSVVDEFGNPSSLHGMGLAVEKRINAAKQTICSKFGGSAKNIYFTSGGTEANNLAIKGAAFAKKREGNRIIVSEIEHPSVLESARWLESKGFDVRFAPVDYSGRVDTDAFSELVNTDTTVVSIMHVNNETGVIQPIEELSKLVRSKAPKAVFHTDCVQSFGKIPINIGKLGVDMISISAHKIHGFKGSGALYTKNTNILPLIHGGEQQTGLRPGTENVGGILAFAAATDANKGSYDEMRKLRQFLIEALKACIADISVNGSDEYNSGSVLNVSFLGIKAEILLHALERHKIYVSTGSACSSHKPQPSHVLTAMGLSQKEIAGAVRISFSNETSIDELMIAADAIAEEVKTIRRYM